MNQVDVYINNERLDLFQDEQISINVSVQNIKDLATIFTDFTQSFTVPASTTNNKIFSHYYRFDVTGGVDGRLRQTARIEINSLTFREGVIELESVSKKNNEPSAYTMTFYGQLVNLKDLFGDDYLYDLDLSAYDHDYDGATILSGFNQESLHGGDIFYPLMSPKNNWFYDSSASTHSPANIAYHNTHNHGVSYAHLKPAVKVVKLFEAIETKYGIDFTGNFMSDTQFNKLFLWAHRREGYMYEGQPNAMTYEKINFNSSTGTYFDLTNDTFDIPSGFGASLGDFTLSFTVGTLSQTANFSVYVNGAYETSQVISSTGSYSFDLLDIQDGDRISLRVKNQDNSTALTYQVTTMELIFYPDTGSPVNLGTASMTGTATVTVTVRVSELLPEMKVYDFLQGIIRAHNVVITPNTSTQFNLQTLDDWYATGSDKDYQEFIDVNEVSINRPSLYNRIAYKYQDTDQILGQEYATRNPSPFGNLDSDFPFDGEQFEVQLPFECPLFEKLTDVNGSAATNILAYKSITREADSDGNLNPYLGAPVLIYGEFPLDISANPLGFYDETSTQQGPINEIWYANVSSTQTGVGTAFSLCWGGDIDPFFLATVPNSLYNTYWSDYITDLYNQNRRVVQVDAVLPIGKIIDLDLKNKILWNNQKWIVNNADINITTGKVRLELLNDV